MPEVMSAVAPAQCSTEIGGYGSRLALRLAGTTAKFESRRVDAAKAVPHGGGGAGGQHRQDAFGLVIAVERNPLQRRQIVRALGENHAGPGRDRGLEAGRLR